MPIPKTLAPRFHLKISQTVKIPTHMPKRTSRTTKNIEIVAKRRHTRPLDTSTSNDRLEPTIPRFHVKNMERTTDLLHKNASTRSRKREEGQRKIGKVARSSNTIHMDGNAPTMENKM
jgi:hypothetical protein